jgi:hypothetical protein
MKHKGLYMKKFILFGLLVSVLVMSISANDHDGFGMGTALYGGYGYGPGLLIKTPVLPLYWGINVSVNGMHNEQYFAVTLSGDYHFLDMNFPKTDKFGWFLGGGIIFSHSHFDGKSAFAGRMPIGIYFAPVNKFDFVLEFAPGVGFYAWDSNVEPDYGMSGSLGVRYWL